MKEKFMRFMQGRYGVDQLSKALPVIGLISVLLASFFRGSLIGTFFYYVGWFLIIYCYFRMFSKNVSKRYAENQAYLAKSYKIRCFFAKQKDLFRQRKQYPQRATLPFYISWYSSKSPCTADLIPAFLPFYVFPYFHPYVSFYVGDGNPPPFILKPENHPHRLLHRIHPLHSLWNQVALHHELSEYFQVLPQFLYFRYCYMRKKQRKHGYNILNTAHSDPKSAAHFYPLPVVPVCYSH